MRTNAIASSASGRNVSLPDLRFDYGVLSSPVEKFLRGQAERIRRQCTSSIIQIGKALLEAKRHLSHGMFLRWVEYEIGVPPRTAQAYMRVAHWASTKRATVAHLPPSALYMLSSSGVPEGFVTEVLERAEAGETIAASGIRRELRAFQVSKSKKSSAKADGAPRTIDKSGQADICVEGAVAVSPIAELAALLAQKLSASDYVRACEILTSESVLSDPGLREKLEQQFLPARTAVSHRSSRLVSSN